MVAPKGHASYAGSETGGRPKIYTKEFIESEAVALENWMKDENNIYFKRFAFERGYSQKRLNEWSHENQMFSETFERVKEWQEIRLSEGGLLNKFNSTITKFLLSNLCGMAERQISTVSSNNTNNDWVHEVSGVTKDLVQEKDGSSQDS